MLFNEILKSTVLNGGASFNVPSETSLVGSSCYAVASYPDRELILDYDKLSIVTVQSYIDNNMDLLKSESNFVGTWVNDGKVYFDISKSFIDLDLAKREAMEKNQLAIFDLKELQEIAIA